MKYVGIFLLALVCASQILACKENSAASDESDIHLAGIPWQQSVQAVIVDGDEFYGKTCSVIRVRSNAGTKSTKVIFNAPFKALTSCAKNKFGENYLKFDGKYIVLYVDRQTFGAGSSTGERYRSSDFELWEEYIGVTWIKGEEYEAWRNVGSTSSRADSRTKVVRQ